MMTSFQPFTLMRPSSGQTQVK